MFRVSVKIISQHRHCQMMYTKNYLKILCINRTVMAIML